MYLTLTRLLAAGETIALATIAEVKGSVPREVGTKMIIHPLGQHVGTIGGGCGEADVIRAALDAIQTGKPRTVAVDLTEEISMQALGVCGGVMNVFVERWEGLSTTSITLLDSLIASQEKQEAVALATVIRSNEPKQVGAKALVWLDRPPRGALGVGEIEGRVLAEAVEALQGGRHRLLRYPDEGLEIFIEVQKRLPRLLIVGAGHIAAPLCELGSLCDFSVTVIDDRPQFATPARFPQADRIIAADIRQTVSALATGEDAYVVLVTRGHSLDVECLVEIIDRPLAYIGMIGSQRRVRAVFDLLAREQGIPRTQLDRVHAPIGLAIGAETPAEIAVSIMAEIIGVLRGENATSPPSLKDERRGRTTRR